MIVKWLPPDDPWLKLNIVGEYNAESGLASGGGILRDHLGCLKLAICFPLRATSIFEAELMTILHGLQEVQSYNRPIVIESSVPLLIALINAKELGPAHSRVPMARLILAQRQTQSCFSFIQREGNKAACLMAKRGVDLAFTEKFDAISAPRLLRAMIRLEQMGTPNIRTADPEEYVF